MAKVYKVWIEIEEHDEETDESNDIDCLGFASSARCDTLEEAQAIAERMHMAVNDTLIIES